MLRFSKAIEIRVFCAKFNMEDEFGEKSRAYRPT